MSDFVNRAGALERLGGGGGEMGLLMLSISDQAGLNFPY